ncbi:MAG: DUF3604 domain-containing protein [Chloroflexi bacterium]|nr:DUF3604 domain-containing protein [Chloroflexota bacterium]
MTRQILDEVLGSARLEIDGPARAGQPVTFRIVYTAGSVGVDDRGAVRVSWRAQAGLGDPQVEDPASPGYLAVRTLSEGSVRPVARFNQRAHRRPFVPAVTVHTDDGGLWPGDRLEMTFGDTSGDSPGIRAPVTVVKAFEFQVSVDCKGAQEFLDLDGFLTFPVVAGPAVRLVGIGPSDVKAGEPFALHARFEDAWGNPATLPGASLRVAMCGRDEVLGTAAGAGPVVAVENLTLEEAGVVRLDVMDQASGLRATSNPIRVGAEWPDQRLWWGDLHGQSGETVGTNSSADYFHYARHTACADFTCHQGNDFQITDEFWARLRREVEEIHQDGEFVCFHGYEWSGNTEVGGDRNVIFRGIPGPNDISRSGHWLIGDRRPLDPSSDSGHLEDLYARLRGRDDVMLLPHVGGRRAELRWLDPRLEPVVEVHSAHGTSEWFLRQALATGAPVGFLAGSDDHMGRPAATLANANEMPVHGGLACIRAAELTRAGLWDGLHARHCHGSTGARILVETEIAGARMGAQAVARGSVPVETQVNGTAPIIEIAVYRHGEPVYRWTPEGDPAHVLVAWTGNLRIARGRKQTWDGELTVRGARIGSVAPFAFDHPEEGLVRSDGQRVRWTSETAGDYDGLRLKLAAANDPEIEFRAGPLTVTRDLQGIADGPIFVKADGLGAHLRIQALPRDGGPLDTRVTWTDHTPPAGLHAYHVRILQLDGHMAWSSPTYVQVGGG